MPVLGSGSTATASTGKRGVYLPAEWGSIFRPARLASGTTRVEVSVMGDSTTFGSADPGRGPSVYSWIRKIRDLATAAGWGDGGHGFLHPSDGSYNFDGDGYPQQTASTGSWAGTGSALAIAYASGTIGDSITFAGKGTSVRLHLPRLNTGSQVSYTVDGGATQTVNTLRPATSGPVLPYDYAPAYVGGLADGIHSVTITNSAAGAISDGVLKPGSEGSYTSGGTLTIGATYYYVSTVTSANGESAPSPVRGNTVGATNRVWTVQYLAGDGHTGAKLYRSTSSTGPFQLVNTVTGTYTYGGIIPVIDDGSLTPQAGVNPPATSTLGTLASATHAEFMVEFLRDTGVTFHRDATSGASLPSFFDSSTDSSITANTSAARLGLTGLKAATNVSNPTIAASPQGARPAYRNTRLLIIQIGTNDVNNATDTAFGVFKENLAQGCRAARAAGADVILISPPYMAAVAPLARQWGGRYSAAAREVAQAHGAAWVDFAEALGPQSQWNSLNYGAGVWGAPHLGQAAYIAEAQFLWDNVLAVAA